MNNNTLKSFLLTIKCYINIWVVVHVYLYSNINYINILFYIFKQWSYCEIMVHLSQPINRGEKNPLSGKNADVKDRKVKLDLCYFFFGALELGF